MLQKPRMLHFDGFYTLIPFEMMLVICSLPDLVSTEAFTYMELPTKLVTLG